MTITSGSVAPGNDTGQVLWQRLRQTAANGGAPAAAASISTTVMKADAATSAAASSAAAAGSNVSSSDFLQLLVSELQNQDPTQPTDPNQYVQQLVGVNSLQQLIQINQTLSSVPAGTTTAAQTDPVIV